MSSFRKLLALAALGASLLLAACGGSSHPSSPSAASSTPATKSASTSSSGLTIGTAKGSVGTYLTGTSGRALYMWMADSKDKSNCSGACAKAWPPVTASSMPQVAGGAHAADLSLISRSDGTKQLAYMGRPLYYFAGDPGPGTTRGQGSNGFGAKWWLMNPAGGPVGASTSNGSSGGSSSGYSSGSSSGY